MKKSIGFCIDIEHLKKTKASLIFVYSTIVCQIFNLWSSLFALRAF